MNAIKLGALLLVVLLAAHKAKADLKTQAACVARKHGIDPVLFQAIVMQESGFKIEAYNARTRDYGLTQINYKTAVAYNLDVTKLKTDASYSLNAGARVLADFQKKYKAKEPFTWWSRYNCGTRRKVGSQLDRCLAYIKLVERHYITFKETYNVYKTCNRSFTYFDGTGL